ncbi:MAG: cell division protein FtsA [Deltaproteobacteria bacterium]|nr:cell division protein FtsA [Deltaproteobacteria bacterium]
MARAQRKDVIVGLDIGTTKICAIVGETTENGIDIVGIGTHPSSGLRKGVVINIDSTVESIKKAIEEAELMAGCEIRTAYVGIAGGHISSLNSHGIVAIKDNEITENDVKRVTEAAKAVAIPLDREVIHVIPQEFIIDDQDGIKEPVGMCGVRLEAKVHIVTGAVSSAQNIVKSCNKAGIAVAELVLEPIASAEAVLTADERELGVVLVDIGGGTTDIAIYSQSSLVHTAVLAVGGNHITNDIAVGLRTPQNEAEKIKLKHGCAMASMVNPDETIEVPGVGGRKPRTVLRKLLAEIIEPRIEEIFSLVQREVVKSGYQDLVASGIVLTGGASILEGMPELAEFIFDMPVKRGMPLGLGGLKDVVNSPKFATAVGLLRYMANKTAGRAKGAGRMFAKFQTGKVQAREKSAGGNVSEGLTGAYDKVRTSMKGWIKDLF